MDWTPEGKTAVVTGANTGIGKEIARELVARGAHVVIASRNRDKCEAAARDIQDRTGKDAVEVMAVDLANFASVRAFADDYLASGRPLHILVNNAGGTWSQRRPTDDGHETTFQVNHLGPFLLTNLLISRLKESAPARIVTTSSTGHNFSRGLDFDDLDREKRPYKSMQAYGDSKLCNIYSTKELARRLEGTGVTAYSFHPGFVRTEFAQGGDTFLLSIGTKLGSPFARSPKKGAETGVFLAACPDLDGLNGEYFFNGKPKRTSSVAQDDAAARRLWEVSEQMVGLSGDRA